ncbi:hypothetical protein MNEG_14418, partial [Monoraphidium neglectum]
MRWIAFVAVVAVALVAAAGTADAKGSNCVSGDLPCACAAAGGKWRDLKSPLVPTCTVAIRHQGGERTFNIFFPRTYDAAKKYPVWVHMHGVYWSDMGDISKQMGYTVPASDATPVWDTLATGPHRDDVIIVYPQATSPGGDLTKRTFWSLPFWRCSVGACIDAGVDDVGYIEKIFNLLPKRLSVDKTRGMFGTRRRRRDRGSGAAGGGRLLQTEEQLAEIYLTGTSAGGMMLENLLCTSSVIPNKVAAAVDIIGGIGAPMRGTCRPAGKRRVPFRILHGEADQ